jgi:phosphate transport system permease protein
LYVLQLVLAQMPVQFQHLPAGQAGLLLNDIRNVVSGAVPMATARPGVVMAARRWQHLSGQSNLAGGLLALCLAVLVGSLAVRSIKPDLRARNRVENAAEWALLGCSGVAVLTTIGIVVSVLYEAIHFFHSCRRSISCLVPRGARRWPCGLIRWVPLGHLVPFRCSPEPC